MTAALARAAPVEDAYPQRNRRRCACRSPTTTMTALGRRVRIRRTPRTATCAASRASVATPGATRSLGGDFKRVNSGVRYADLCKTTATAVRPRTTDGLKTWCTSTRLRFCLMTASPRWCWSTSHRRVLPVQPHEKTIAVCGFAEARGRDRYRVFRRPAPTSRRSGFWAARATARGVRRQGLEPAPDVRAHEVLR